MGSLIARLPLIACRSRFIVFLLHFIVVLLSLLSLKRRTPFTTTLLIARFALHCRLLSLPLELSTPFTVDSTTRSLFHTSNIASSFLSLQFFLLLGFVTLDCGLLHSSIPLLSPTSHCFALYSKTGSHPSLPSLAPRAGPAHHYESVATTVQYPPPARAATLQQRPRRGHRV